MNSWALLFHVRHLASGSFALHVIFVNKPDGSTRPEIGSILGNNGKSCHFGKETQKKRGRREAAALVEIS